LLPTPSNPPRPVLLSSHVRMREGTTKESDSEGAFTPIPQHVVRTRT
jgi:hypothetical protein